MNSELDWDALVKDLGPRLYRHFCVRFRSDQADDFTQETLLRLVRKIREGKWDATRGTIQMFAFGIAHYVALENREPRSSPDSIEDWQDSLLDSTDLERFTITKQMALQVRQCISQLSEMEQQVLALLVDQELSLNEIACILQCPEGTIKSHVFRAKKKLFQMLQKVGYG